MSRPSTKTSDFARAIRPPLAARIMVDSARRLLRPTRVQVSRRLCGERSAFSEQANPIVLIVREHDIGLPTRLRDMLHCSLQPPTRGVRPRHSSRSRPHHMGVSNRSVLHHVVQAQHIHYSARVRAGLGSFATLGMPPSWCGYTPMLVASRATCENGSETKATSATGQNDMAYCSSV